MRQITSSFLHWIDEDERSATMDARNQGGPSILLSNPLSNTGLANLMPPLRSLRFMTLSPNSRPTMARTCFRWCELLLDAGQTPGLVGESGA